MTHASTGAAATPAAPRRLAPRIMVIVMIGTLALYMQMWFGYIIWPPHHHLLSEYWGHGPLLWVVRLASVALIWGYVRMIRAWGRRM